MPATVLPLTPVFGQPPIHIRIQIRGSCEGELKRSTPLYDSHCSRFPSLSRNWYMRSPVMDAVSSTKRDIKNHFLFEIATEVANRGKQDSSLYAVPVLTLFYSGRYLFRPQVQGSCDHRRIWRTILSYWSSEPRIGKLAAHLKPPLNHPLPDPFQRPPSKSSPWSLPTHL